MGCAQTAKTWGSSGVGVPHQHACHLLLSLLSQLWMGMEETGASGLHRWPTGPNMACRHPCQRDSCGAALMTNLTSDLLLALIASWGGTEICP